MSESLDLSDVTPSHTLTAVSSFNSSDEVSPQPAVPSTPPTTLDEHFRPTTEGTTRRHFPSPPEKDMPIAEVHARMQRLILVSPSWFESFSPLWYDKLCYAIRHDLDQHFPWGVVSAYTLLNENTAIGKRYQALYSARGDEVSHKSKAVAKGIETFEHYIEHHFPKYRNNDANVYSVFRDPRHTNMEPFYRIQEFGGNCFLQAPILLHWYLSLWYNEEKRAEDVNLIDLSRFVRTRMTGKKLYEYIFDNTGGDSRRILPQITRCAAMQKVQNHASPYQNIREDLEKYGPALVIMDQTHEDFHEANKFEYEGSPTGKAEGHAMVLIGVRKDNCNQQTYFLLQNFWEGKQFVEVRQDYLIHSSDMDAFYFIEHKCDERDRDPLYSRRTGSMRIAQSSSLLERSNQGSRQR